jgi:Acetyltransferase (GNAT) domain
MAPRRRVRWTARMIDPRPLPGSVGAGLVLRTARAGDAEQLAEFNASVHADDTIPGEALAEWTLELFEIPPPGFRAEDDIVVVEDTASGRLVSSLCLIPQTWSYAGVPTSVGQPELVGTHPDYRRRGLVRVQFEAIHARSAELGQQWQIIGGIPWYYRQFGYSYALDLPPFPTWRWGRTLPERPDGFTLRPAVEADVPFLARLDEAAATRPWLCCLRGVDGMTYEVTRRPGALPTGRVLVVEESPPGAPHGAVEPIGCVVHSSRVRHGRVHLWILELVAGRNWLEPTAAVLAHVAAWGAEHPDGPATGVTLLMPDGHPARRCVSTRLEQPVGSPYGLYVRVPDLPEFLRAVAPALDARVESSPAVGFCGELTIDLFTERLELRFDTGRLVAVERVVAPEGTEDSVDLRMPHEAVLHLLLGNRSLAEVGDGFADCAVGTDRGGLLGEVLFPRMPLTAWTVG